MNGITVLVVFWLACFECANNGYGKRKIYVSNSNQVQYFLEVTNFTVSKGAFNFTFNMNNVQWINGEYVRYYSVWLELFRPIHVAKMNLKAERCENIRYKCEHFITINVNDTRPYCQFLLLPKYGFESYIRKVTPKDWFKNCPRFEKGMYKLENGTAGDLVKAGIAIYAELPKYYWQFYALFRDPKNAVIIGVHLEVHFTAYVKRRTN